MRANARLPVLDSRIRVRLEKLMRWGSAAWLGLALAMLAGCGSSKAPLVGVTGASGSSTTGTTTGSSTGTSSTGSTGSGASGGSSGTSGTSSTTGTTGGTTGARFACDLGDGGLFAAAYTIDAGVGPVYRLPSESAGHLISLGDADGDGNLDILMADPLSGDIGLLLGKGDGSFQGVRRTAFDGGVNPLLLTPSGARGKALSIVGVETDLTPQLEFLQLLQTGVAKPYPSIIRAASQLVTADLNNDGWPDLLAAGSDIAIYLGGASGFTALPTVSAWSVVQTPLVDFDEDGILDLLARTADNGLELFRGNGDGTFAPGEVVVASSAQWGNFEVLVGDVNEDGHQDLIVTMLENNSFVEFLGVGDGSFVEGNTVALSCNPMFACDLPMYLLDLNGDGHLDLVESTFDWPNDTWNLKFAFGNGDGTFQPGVADPPIPVGPLQFGDLNNDGRPDLIITRWMDGNVDVRLNNCK
jgi:hypothetical protein